MVLLSVLLGKQDHLLMSGFSVPGSPCPVNVRSTDCRFELWIVKCNTSDDDAYCNLCKKTFSVSNGGVSQVLQHKQGSKHVSLELASKQQPRLLCASGSLSMGSNRKIVVTGRVNFPS